MTDLSWLASYIEFSFYLLDSKNSGLTEKTKIAKFANEFQFKNSKRNREWYWPRK